MKVADAVAGLVGIDGGVVSGVINLESSALERRTGDHAMTNITTKLESEPGAAAVHLFDNWFDPIETGLRDRVREFIHTMIEGELDLALSRSRYARRTKLPSGEAGGVVGASGHRHGHRSRSLLGSFGQVEIEVPRARLNTPDGKATEWKSKALRAYQRRTLVADALIAGAYLAGTNTRRVRWAL